MNRSNKLECYITLGSKGLSGTNTLAYWNPFISYVENELLRLRTQGSISQHLVFFETYEWAQKASVFVLGKTFWPDLLQHSSFLGPYISYTGNEMLWILSQFNNSQIHLSLIKYFVSITVCNVLHTSSLLALNPKARLGRKIIQSQTL